MKQQEDISKVKSSINNDKINIDKMSEKITVRITEEFKNKYKWLCLSVPNNEWSGMLFYDIEGDINDTETFVIIPKEIFLMDIGSMAYTEYDVDSDLMKFRISRKDLRSCQLGHIHSHNKMNVFFSGTDMSELLDNCNCYNYYFSMIVNNNEDVTGKVAALTKSKTISIRNSKGEYCDICNNNNSACVYDCDILFDKKDILVSDEFIERFKIVKDKKEKLSKLNTLQNKFASPTLFDDNTFLYDNGTGISKDFNDKDLDSIYFDGNDDFFYFDEIMKFLEEIFKSSMSIKFDGTFGELLDEINSYPIDHKKSIVKKVISKFTKKFNTDFKNNKEDVLLEIDLLVSDLTFDYPFLEELSNNIEKINRYEQYKR